MIRQKIYTMEQLERNFQLMLRETYSVGMYQYTPEKYGYIFAFDMNAVSRVGQCSPRRRLIQISRRVCEFNLGNWPALREIMLHEIAHAVAFGLFKSRGHDNKFRRVAWAMGCAEVTSVVQDKSLRIPHRYTYGCPACGMRVERNRKLKDVSCARCNPGWYDARYKLELKTVNF